MGRRKFQFTVSAGESFNLSVGESFYLSAGEFCGAIVRLKLKIDPRFDFVWHFYRE